MGGAQQHGEAPVVAWTKINVNGLEITLTARSGATSDEIVNVTRELYKACKIVTGGSKPAETPPAQPQAHLSTNGNGNGAQRPAQSAFDSEFDRLPTHERSAYTPAQAVATAQANGYPPAGQYPAPVATLDNGAADPGWCQIHQCAMTRRERDGKVWYSHKVADGTWCKGKPKGSR